MAGEEGFEPPLAESESAVLPLDDSPMFKHIATNLYGYRQTQKSRRLAPALK